MYSNHNRYKTAITDTIQGQNTVQMANPFSLGCILSIVLKSVQSVKSRQIFSFFLKNVVNIAILKLGLVPNENPGNFAYYRGIL